MSVLAGTTEAQGGMTTRSGFLDQNTSMFGINGGRTGESEILIDGAPSTAINALPNVVGNPKANRSVNHWFNMAAFQGTVYGTTTALNCDNPASNPCQPYLYQFGDEGQRQSNIREAPIKNLDLGIGKEFGTERIHAELRGDFLNAFNHPVYGGSWNIQENLYATDFGQVYGTRNDPRNVQVSLKVTY